MDIFFEISSSVQSLTVFPLSTLSAFVIDIPVKEHLLNHGCLSCAAMSSYSNIAYGITRKTHDCSLLYKDWLNNYKRVI